MTDKQWMIYGASGYTGSLIAEEAAARGRRPILAGRDASKLAPLAERLGLEYRAFKLHKNDNVPQDIGGVDLVLHCAGPFTFTAGPMLGACLNAGVHYLDITGELAVLENSFVFHGMAQQRRVAVISGCGFDVIPTDCMAKYVAGQVPGAVDLEIAFAMRSYGTPSAGTAQSAIEIGRQGGLVRREGRLVPYPLGHGVKTVRFPHGERHVMPVPWGDLVTAYCSTGIPNITTYLRYRPDRARLVRLVAPAAHILLQVKAARRLLQAIIDRTVRGPSAQARETGKSFIWACAGDRAGTSAEAWLETLEGYQFTKLAAVRCVEKVLAGDYAGALTPSLAFGADFVLDIPGTRRFDSLPER